MQKLKFELLGWHQQTLCQTMLWKVNIIGNRMLPTLLSVQYLWGANSPHPPPPPQTQKKKWEEKKKNNTALNVLDELPVYLVSYCIINIQPILKVRRSFTAQKMKKSFMQNLIFCAVVHVVRWT